MPYIEQTNRKTVLADPKLVATPGELNFIITTLLIKSPLTIDDNVKRILQYAGDYINRYGARYSTFNDVLGVFTAVAFEYKDRVKVDTWVNAVQRTMGMATVVLYTHEIRPYEDRKIQENGDVYL